MKCENCDIEISFWAMVKQPTPFRFKCAHCGTQYTVETPYMKRIMVGIVFLLFILTIGILEGTKRFGVAFLVPFLVFLTGILLALEAWTQRYIFKKGKFIKIEKKAKPDG